MGHRGDILFAGVAWGAVMKLCDFRMCLRYFMQKPSAEDLRHDKELLLIRRLVGLIYAEAERVRDPNLPKEVIEALVEAERLKLYEIID